MASDFDKLYDGIRSHLHVELKALCEVWDKLPPADRAAMTQVLKNLASCTAAEQLGLGYSKLELDAATAALANFKVGLEIIARKRLYEAAKRVGGWLLEQAYEIGSRWLSDWAQGQMDRM